MHEYGVKLLEKKHETHDVMTFRFEKPESFSYKAGQYIILRVDNETKPFTLASSPTEDFLQITTMIRGSGFKNGLVSAEIGDKFQIEGPYGMFTLKPGNCIMLGGGIGITPFRSMIRFATDSRLTNKIILIYSNRTPEDIVFREEFDALEEMNRDFRIINTITRPENTEWHGRTGRIDSRMIEEFSEGNEIFYICGPPAMVKAMMDILIGMNIPEERIRVEEFAGY